MNDDLPGYLTGRVNGDAARVHRSRWINLTFLLGIGEMDYRVTIRDGPEAGAGSNPIDRF